MKYGKEQFNRIHRVEGQIRGVLRMMEQGKSCKEVVPQLSAIRNAVDRTAAVLVADNLKKCILEAQNHSGDYPEERMEEAVRLLVKSR
jgi:DNA-binding FrmR family transcriptional regulator